MANTPYGQIHIKYDGTTTVKPAYEKMKRSTIIELLLVSGILGFCVLGFDYASIGIAKVIVNTPIIVEYYNSSESMFYIVQALYSIAAIMIPFAIGMPFIKLIQKDTEILPLDAPKSKPFFFGSLAMAFLVLVLSNFITSLGVLLFENLGFVFDSSETETPETVSGLIWEVFAVGVVPAVVEEFAMRGVVLQSLRKYGDIFAIVISAALFGLMHGNFTQAPFAFILGAAIAWLVIETGSLWTGIGIHFMNNVYAIIINMLSDKCSTTVYIVVVAIINITGMMLGLFAFLMLVDKHKNELKLKNPYKWEPYVFAVVSIPMLAAIIRLIMNCIETVHYVGFLK